LVTPGLDVHCPLEYSTRKEVVGFRELTKWTGLVRNMIIEAKVLHDGDRVLAEHIGRAVASRHQQGVVLSSTKSTGSIELARLAVWAVARATRATWTTSRPTIASSRR
jgi:hypothetical protein